MTMHTPGAILWRCSARADRVARRGKSAAGVRIVRADVTYLRQDFSLMQPVANPPKDWPKYQRFDYLTRLRWLDPAEAVHLEHSRDRATKEYRENLLFALRGLTGQDEGSATANWRPLLTRAEFAPERHDAASGAIKEWKQLLNDEP